MSKFFQFLYRFRLFILFLLLEGIGIWLIVNNNPYQSSIYFNSSNNMTASILQLSSNISDYYNLIEQNALLIEQNKILHQNILNRNIRYFTSDSTKSDNMKISFLSAKVINKSLFYQNNYITIDKGLKHGVKKGMGVIGLNGVVGQVHIVSNNYSTIYSLLHSDVLVSSVHKKSNSLCTTSWNGIDPNYSKINYLPIHVEVSIGDTIATSGYNAIFPKNILIGIVDKVNIQDNATFYEISIKNITDFYTLSFVYLLSNNIKSEKDSIEVIQNIVND